MHVCTRFERKRFEGQAQVEVHYMDHGSNDKPMPVANSMVRFRSCLVGKNFGF
jgi:hypothetical protein